MAKRAKRAAGNAAEPKPRQGKTSKTEAAERNALPASVSAGNPDRTREVQRRESSQGKFQTNLSDEEARQKDRAQHSRVERDALKADEETSKGTRKRAKTLSEQQTEDKKGLREDNVSARGQIDHAIVNHQRGEHEHNIGASRASIEGPAPIRLKEVPNDAQILETIRLETKADNLYFMRREERESDGPRQWVIDALNARLREVQGDPILPE